jgi:hypothetical protein
MNRVLMKYHIEITLVAILGAVSTVLMATGLAHP